MATNSTRIVDPVFDHDMFLFREKHLAIAKKYVILNEDGQSILFVERPARMARRILAVLAGIVAAPVFGVFIGACCRSSPTTRFRSCWHSLLLSVRS